MKQKLLFLLSLIISACSTDTGRTLRHADSVMEEHPDSALSILKRIDRQTLKGSDLPYFALLYTQAQVKTDMYPTSDSLISIAYAKYGNDTRGDLGIRSNFYTGEIFFNQEKYREAMRFYLTAYEESKRLRNDYWHAKAAERISDLFFFSYNYDDAEKYVQQAAELYKGIGIIDNSRYALCDLATVMLNNGDEERSFIILDSLRNVCIQENPVDTAFLKYLGMPRIDAMLKTGRMDSTILDELNSRKNFLSDENMIDLVILKSQICNLIDKPENGEKVLSEIDTFVHSDEDKVHILYARYENAKIVGDNALVISLTDSLLYYQNKVAEDIIQESVVCAQRDFYSDMSFFHERKSFYLKCLLWGSVIVFILLMALIVTFSILNNKTQKAKLRANLEAFLSLKMYSDQVVFEKKSLELLVREMGCQNETMVSQIQSLQSVKDQLKLDYCRIIERLFKEKWNTLDVLCDQYFGLKNSELSPKDLISNMEKELKKIVSKKGLAEIVSSVDTYMGGIVSSLRDQCAFLKEDDIAFMALLYAGFSVRAVCMFTGIKYPNFYVKKSRLIKRIQSSDAPDKSLFLEKINPGFS